MGITIQDSGNLETSPVAPRTNTLRGDKMVQLKGQGRHVMGQAQGLSRVKLSLLFLSCKTAIISIADSVAPLTLQVSHTHKCCLPPKSKGMLFTAA